MKSLLRIILICFLLLVFMTSCSDNEESSSVEEAARNTGKKLAEEIQKPIDKAQEVKELSEKLNEKTREAAASD